MTDAEKDAAWRSLPKEVRKEVSDYYKEWRDSLSFGGECEVLDYIFGKHNLTANEEPIQDKTMNKEELLKSRKERGKQTLNIGDQVRAISASGKPLYDGKVATIIEKGMSGDEVYYGLYIEGVTVEKRSTPLIGKSEIIGNTSLLVPFFAEDLELVKSHAEEEKPKCKQLAYGDKVIILSEPFKGIYGEVFNFVFDDGRLFVQVVTKIGDKFIEPENLELISSTAQNCEKSVENDIPCMSKEDAEELAKCLAAVDDFVKEYKTSQVDWLAYRMELAKEIAVNLSRKSNDTTAVIKRTMTIVDELIERLKGGEK